MCANCLSAAEVAVGQAVVIGAVLEAPVRRALVRCGVIDAPDPVARDARTVRFLRSLDVDPAAVLGAGVVNAADRWIPQSQVAGSAAGWRRRRRWASSARPIGSHSLITAT
jgi:hypothetical protein